jgi:glutaredoxin
MKLYYKDGCTHCIDTKQKLNLYGIKYTAINLSDKEMGEERKNFRALGYNYLPIIVLDNGKVITDCSPEAIMELVKYGDLNEN